MCFQRKRQNSQVSCLNVDVNMDLKFLITNNVKVSAILDTIPVRRSGIRSATVTNVPINNTETSSREIVLLTMQYFNGFPTGKLVY